MTLLLFASQGLFAVLFADFSLLGLPPITLLLSDFVVMLDWLLATPVWVCLNLGSLIDEGLESF